MKVELSWDGERVDVQLTKEEAESLCSFMNFNTRVRLSKNIMSNEEYNVAERLSDEISSYITE